MRLTYELIFILFSIVAICADITIIYVIFRFKQMRTKPNILLANWAIADICSLIVTPSAYKITTFVYDLEPSLELMCVILYLGSALHIVLIIFVIAVAIDWFIAAYFYKASAILSYLYACVIILIWTSALLIISVDHIRRCIRYHEGYHFLNSALFGLTYCILLLIIFVLQSFRIICMCMKIGKTLNRPTLMLTLSTAYACNFLLTYSFFIWTGLETVHPIFDTIASCALFSNSLVNLYLLYKLNTDFQACILHTFKWCYSEEEDSVCNAEKSPERTLNGDCFVEVSLQKPHEELPNSTKCISKY